MTDPYTKRKMLISNTTDAIKETVATAMI